MNNSSIRVSCPYAAARLLNKGNLRHSPNFPKQGDARLFIPVNRYAENPDTGVSKRCQFFPA